MIGQRTGRSRLGLVSAAVALVLVTSGCGGGSTPNSGNKTTYTLSEVDRAAIQIVEDLGQDAPVAVVAAAARGYAVDVVVQGGLASRVSADGLVTGTDGGVIAPTGEQVRLRVPAGSGGHATGSLYVEQSLLRTVAQDDPSLDDLGLDSDLVGRFDNGYEVTQASAERQLQDQAELADPVVSDVPQSSGKTTITDALRKGLPAAVILELVFAGYTVDQIVTAIVLGEDVTVSMIYCSGARVGMGIVLVGEKPAAKGSALCAPEDQVNPAQAGSTETSGDQGVPEGTFNGTFDQKAYLHDFHVTNTTTFKTNRVTVTVKGGAATLDGRLDIEMVTGSKCLTPDNYTSTQGHGHESTSISFSGTGQWPTFDVSYQGTTTDDACPTQTSEPLTVQAALKRDGDGVSGVIDLSHGFSLSFSAS